MRLRGVVRQLWTQHHGHLSSHIFSFGMCVITSRSTQRFCCHPNRKVFFHRHPLVFGKINFLRSPFFVNPAAFASSHLTHLAASKDKLIVILQNAVSWFPPVTHTQMQNERGASKKTTKCPSNYSNYAASNNVDFEKKKFLFFFIIFFISHFFC